VEFVRILYKLTALKLSNFLENLHGRIKLSAKPLFRIDTLYWNEICIVITLGSPASLGGNDMLNRPSTAIAGCIMSLVLFCISMDAAADPIDPGSQFQVTVPGVGDPISNPMGTFFFPAEVPGQPFGAGPPVPMEGIPLGAPGFGNTDTIIEVQGSLGAGETGTIPVEIVAMSLRSVDPVDIGGTLFDVEVLPDLTNPSMGTFDFTDHDDPYSGTKYISHFDVFFDIRAEEVGNPSNVIEAFGITDPWTGFSDPVFTGYSENGSHIPFGIPLQIQETYIQSHARDCALFRRAQRLTTRYSHH
jgi:hypothetical protein